MTMDRTRFQQIEDVFNRALDVPAAEREVWLDGACDGDAALRLEVVELLASAADTSISLHDVVASEADHVAREASASAVGRRLGPYRLKQLLGEGGMGAVYLADRDDAQFAKQVAVKILPRALGSPQAVARFRDERQILAALEHRHIVRLLDGGADDDLPYLVMEYVEGRPITAYARERELSVRARVELVRDVCAALQFAHQNLIIHRDIKPSNILIDASGTAKLLDFGIAKLLSPVPGIEREAQTRTGHALFTPEYASPEQARGEPVTTAADVYSVGAVLYELVTGRPPHKLGDRMIENLRIICEVDPPRPSAAAPLDRRREVAGDLDNIILKALHKDPARRYASIEQLSADLGRYLEGLPVDARVATLAYRVRKFVGRNRAAVVAVSAVAVALVAAAVISLAQARRADRAAAEAVAEKASAVSAAQRAQAEAERARRAEAQVQTQLDQLKAEQTARAAAESTAREKGTEAAMTREQLAAALDNARAEARAAEAEGQKARAAEQRAEQAAAAERTTRIEAEALYQREKARRELLEKRSKEITTTLR
ncbi:MAG TPA: serine/threonine-protein kinase [Kofleriaceae bacterium]|nr:serine/threonine-protein kinase [Kofleriaceae bacterium]